MTWFYILNNSGNRTQEDSRKGGRSAGLPTGTTSTRTDKSQGRQGQRNYWGKEKKKRLMEKAHRGRLGKNLVKKKKTQESLQAGGRGGRTFCELCHPLTFYLNEATRYTKNSHPKWHCKARIAQTSHEIKKQKFKRDSANLPTVTQGWGMSRHKLESSKSGPDGL